MKCGSLSNVKKDEKKMDHHCRKTTHFIETCYFLFILLFKHIKKVYDMD